MTQSRNALHQPFASLLAVDPDTARITHASANTAQIFGHNTNAMLGQSLRDLLGSEVSHALRNAASHPDFATAPVALSAHGALAETTHLQAVAAGPLYLLEAAPLLPSEFGSTTTLDVVQTAMGQLVTSDTDAALATRLNRFLHRVTGYNHVIWWKAAPRATDPMVALAQAKRRSRDDAHAPLTPWSEVSAPTYPMLHGIADATALPVPLHAATPAPPTAPDLSRAFSALHGDPAQFPDDTLAHVAMRITRGNHPVGLLEMRSSRPRRPSPDLIAALKALHPFLDVTLRAVVAAT